MSESPLKLYTIDEFADLIGSTRKTVYDWLHRGGAPAHIKIGRFIRFPEKAIVDWVAANTQAATVRKPRYRPDRAPGARVVAGATRRGRPRKAGLADGGARSKTPAAPAVAGGAE